MSAAERHALATTFKELGVEVFDTFGMTATRTSETADGVHYYAHKGKGDKADTPLLDEATGTRSTCKGAVGPAWQRAVLEMLCNDDRSRDCP